MKAHQAKSVRLLGHSYEIRREYCGEIGNPGETCVFPNIIRIAKDLPASSQNEILLHELIESIINRFNIESHIDHDHIVLISEVLHQVLRDNKLEFYEDKEEAKLPSPLRKRKKLEASD